MFWLEHKVVIFIRQYQAHKRFTAHAVLQTMRNNLVEIRLPFAKVVVHVDRRYAHRLRSFFQFGDLLPNRHRQVKQRLATVELKIIDDVDQQEGSACSIWYVSM